MKYMVCRKDAVDRHIKSSEVWPIIVEVSAFRPFSYEEVIAEAVKRWPNYMPMNKEIYIIPMEAAVIVTLEPKKEYTVKVVEV